MELRLGLVCPYHQRTSSERRNTRHYGVHLVMKTGRIVAHRDMKDTAKAKERHIWSEAPL